MSRDNRGVLFDLDGVLIDSEQAHFEATRQAFRHLRLPELTEDLYRSQMIGRPDREAIAAAMHALGIPASWLEPVLEAKAGFYQELLAAGRVDLLVDGIAAVHAALEAGYPVALVTGALAVEAHWALRAAGLMGRITTVVTAEDVRAGKPDPEPYRTACSRLGVEPGRSVAVEDSPAGVSAGRAAGLRVLAVARQPFPELAAADRVVTELSWEAIADLLARSR
jgi:beta-phosphoglucomutase-like phosphatase (HAD superfamily)